MSEIEPRLVEKLEQAHLRYTTDDIPGYTRLRWGNGFTYRDAKGETVRDSKTRRWFTSLVIPPAWQEVWISPYRNAHLLATGRDDKGRKQYLYHPKWDELRNRAKFDKLYEFGQVLPHLRKTVRDHLSEPELSHQKVLALVVTLLEKTLIRVGNREYADKNDTYGLTTMRDRHVRFDEHGVTFEFTGKSGKDHAITVEDEDLVRAIRECRDISGYQLFQYIDGSHKDSIDSSDVNDYLRDITGQEITAKIFRTWGGSALAMKVLYEVIRPEEGEFDCEGNIRECITRVAQELGNTKAVSRDYYIHPDIFDAFRESDLAPFYDNPMPDLLPEESALMRLIEHEVRQA